MKRGVVLLLVATACTPSASGDRAGSRPASEPSASVAVEPSATPPPAPMASSAPSTIPSTITSIIASRDAAAPRDAGAPGPTVRAPCTPGGCTFEGACDAYFEIVVWNGKACTTVNGSGCSFKCTNDSANIQTCVAQHAKCH